MAKLRRLCIPEEEKEKGIVWVEYPICGLYWWRVQAIAELEINPRLN